MQACIVVTPEAVFPWRGFLMVA